MPGTLKRRSCSLDWDKSTGSILKGAGGRKYVFVAILYQKRNKRFCCVQQRNWVCCTRAIKDYVLYWVCCTVGTKDCFIFWVCCTDYFIFWVCCTIGIKDCFIFWICCTGAIKAYVVDIRGIGFAAQIISSSAFVAQ